MSAVEGSRAYPVSERRRENSPTSISIPAQTFRTDPKSTSRGSVFSCDASTGQTTTTGSPDASR